MLVKEGASDKEKCQLFHKSVADGKKDGRNKERRAKIQSEANCKSPLEICQNIKNKQIRVAMRCLLRNREQVKLSCTDSESSITQDYWTLCPGNNNQAFFQPPKSSKKSASNSPRKKVQNRKDQ